MLKSTKTFVLLGTLLTSVFSGVFISTAYAATTAPSGFTVYNKMTGVDLCYNSTNAGGNSPKNPPGNTSGNILPNSMVFLPTGSGAYWAGANYDLRPDNCANKCDANTCPYLGNVNLATQGDPNPPAVVASFSQTTPPSIQDLQLQQDSNDRTVYAVTGTYDASQQTGQAQTIVNRSPYLLCNGQVNKDNNGNPTSITYNPANKAPASSNELKRGDSVVLNVNSSPFWSGVSYDIRQGGCSTNDAYFGNVNFATSTTNGTTSVVMTPTGPDVPGVTIGLQVNTDCANNVCTFKSIKLTPPAQSSIDPVHTYTQAPTVAYRGVNLAGSEFGEFWSPGNVPFPSEVNYYVDKGMNTVRLPIRWAYLQPAGPGVGPLDANYIAFIKNVLENLTSAGVNVVLDLHDYQRYAPQGETVGVPEGAPTGSQPNGVIITTGKDGKNPLATIWSDIVTQILTDPNIKTDHLIYDISNEPAQMQTQTILDNENAAIAAIRAAEGSGYHSLILVEGNVFSGLWAWTDTNQTYNNREGSGTIEASSQVFTPANIKDSANNYAINVHQYFDSNGSMSGTTNDCLDPSTLLTSINATPFLNWVQANGVKVFVTEFGVGRGNNCSAALSTFLTWVQQNAYVPANGSTPATGGFIGWTIWSGGHAWGGYPANLNGAPNYVLDVSPNGNVDSPQMTVLAAPAPNGYLN